MKEGDEKATVLERMVIKKEVPKRMVMENMVLGQAILKNTDPQKALMEMMVLEHSHKR